MIPDKRVSWFCSVTPKLRVPVEEFKQKREFYIVGCAIVQNAVLNIASRAVSDCWLGLSNVILRGKQATAENTSAFKGRTLPADDFIFSSNGKILYREKLFQLMYLLNENSAASSILILWQIFFKNNAIKINNDKYDAAIL